jgi:hypothetical protein
MIQFSNSRYASALSRHSLPELCWNGLSPSPIRGSRKCRGRAAPAVSCAKLCEETHTSIQVQRRHPGIPCAMTLRLMPRSPRRRIHLVTVAAGLMAVPIRSDRGRHRQLDTSNGCRDHTVLPYALAPFVRAPLLAHGKPPCEHLRADAAASTASPPTFVTTRDRPSCRERTGRAGSADLPDEGSEILPVVLFCRSLGAAIVGRIGAQRVRAMRGPMGVIRQPE